MTYSSVAINLLSALVLLFASCVALVSCQGEQQLVYRGTGVNGSHDRTTDSNDDIIVLGGLFLVHDGKNKKCDQIRIDYIQRMEAMVLAIHKINSDDSLLPGVTLAYEIRDTCGNTNVALEQTLRFVTEGRVKNGKRGSVSGVIGPAFSFISISVASLLRLFQIPQISFGSTADTLSDKSRFDYFLRTVPPDSLQARAIADIIIHFKWTYIIAIFSDDVYGRGGIASLKTELELMNSSVCIAVTRAISDSTDYDKIVETINQEWITNSSVIVMYAHLSHSECLLEAALQKGKIDKEFAQRNITWIGSDSWGGISSLKYGNLIHGALHTTVRVPPNKEFEDYFLSLHPSNNSANPWFGEYWEEMFNCSLGGRINVEECDLDNQVLSQSKRYIHITHASLTTDAVYAFAHAIHNMQQDRCPDGRGLCAEILDQSDFLKGGAINGELLLKYLYQVSFNGASADKIEFDGNGDVKGSYKIINAQKDTDGHFAYTPVGRWDGAGTEEQSMPLQFNKNVQWKHSLNGSDVPISICSQPCREGEYQQHAANQPECCWTCKQCESIRQISDGVECHECDLGYRPSESKSKCEFIQPSFLRWHDPLAVVLIMLAILGIAATTFVSVVLVVFNKDRIIKASSRELSAVLLCGIMLCYLLPFIYIAEPSPVLCAIRRLGVGFCFSICFSALLVKTNRIHRIFNRKKSESIMEAPPLISPQSQLLFTAILVAIQVVIATVWLVVEQPSTVFLYDDFNTDLLCGENPYIGFSVTLAYNLLLLIVTTYFAFRTRRVPQNFNEAKFINITVYSLCILWLAFIPMYFVSTSVLRTSFQTASLTIAIMLTATVCLCCLLAPKIYFLFSSKQQKQGDRSDGSTNTDTFGTNRKLSTTAHGQMSVSCKIIQIDAAIQTEN